MTVFETLELPLRLNTDATVRSQNCLLDRNSFVILQNLRYVAGSLCMRGGYIDKIGTTRGKGV